MEKGTQGKGSRPDGGSCPEARPLSRIVWDVIVRAALLIARAWKILAAGLGGVAAYLTTASILCAVAVVCLWPFSDEEVLVRIDIASSMLNPLGNDDPAQEYVCLVSVSDDPTRMLAWELHDANGHRYTFPEYALSPGATVRVHTGVGDGSTTDLFWNRGSPVWDNTGDTVTLLDEDDDEVDSVAYGDRPDGDAVGTCGAAIVPDATRAGPMTTPIEIPGSTSTLAPTGELATEFVSVSSPVAPGSEATVQVSATPGAACSIVVMYRSGPSQAQGLEPKTAGPEGTVSWGWTVGTQTTPGDWPITVTCDGETIETTFTVR